jgi:transaldolase
MGIYLDSASVAEAERAAALGFVAGVTTNPKLLAREDRPPEELVPALCDALGQGLVFYQLNAPSLDERESEARRMLALRPGRVGLKIPCTTEDMALLCRLAAEGAVCAATAVFSAHQGYLACEAGARFLIPYVNRATRLLGDGLALVRELAAVCAALEDRTTVLAASLRSPQEAVDAVLAGASHASLPLQQILALGEHPLTRQALAEFAQATSGG